MGAALKPAFAGLKVTVGKLREKVEGAIQSKMQVIVDLEKKIEDKIQSKNLNSLFLCWKLIININSVYACMHYVYVCILECVCV